MNSNTITISIKTTIAWVAIYLLVCGIVPTILDKMNRRNLEKKVSAWLNLTTLIALNSIFLVTLIRRYQIKVSFFSNISLKGILLAFGCSVLFFLLLDNLLDPLFDSIFVASADEYRKAIEALRQFPLVSFIRVCLLAPVVEEILIRGCILDSLRNKYGVILALLISSLLFAILHFNFVQTISALICGLILGLLYISTGSLLSCILAHSLYNTISWKSQIAGR